MANCTLANVWPCALGLCQHAQVSCLPSVLGSWEEGSLGVRCLSLLSVLGLQIEAEWTGLGARVKGTDLDGCRVVGGQAVAFPEELSKCL